MKLQRIKSNSQPSYLVCYDAEIEYDADNIRDKLNALGIAKELELGFWSFKRDEYDANDRIVFYVGEDCLFEEFKNDYKELKKKYKVR